MVNQLIISIDLPIPFSENLLGVQVMYVIITVVARTGFPDDHGIQF